MDVIVEIDGKVTCDNSGGTQNENNVKELVITIPEKFADFNKKIVFIIGNKIFWDVIVGDTYLLTRAVTQYENVTFYIWLTKDDMDFRSQEHTLTFYNNYNCGKKITQEEIEPVNTIINILENELTRVSSWEQEIQVNESTRIVNEQERENRETIRNWNEDNRNSREAERVEAETQRQETFSQMQAEHETAVNNIIDMTANYNDNATAKIQVFNTNAENKTSTFNTNATNKTTAFNTNATTKTESFNTHVSEKTEEFGDIVTDRMLQLNSYTENRIVDMNTNAIEKTNEFNANATSQTETFNTNATNKTDEYNQNAQTKLDEYNTNAEELANRVTELESQVIELSEENTSLKSQIPTGETTGNPIHLSDSSDLECEISVVGNAEQDGEPTPDIPVEVVTVGQNGSVEIDVCNKNQFDIDNFKALNSENAYETYNNVECLKLKGVTQEYNFNGKENTQYTFQFNVIGWTYANIGAFLIKYSDGTNGYYEVTNTGKYTITSTAGKTVTGIKWNGWSAGHYIYIDKNSMQLEVGTEVTELVPHESQTVSLPIQQEFVKIGDTEDIFVKQDGKWYEKHVIKKVSLVDLGNYIKSDSYSDDTYFCGYLNKGISNALSDVKLGIMCNKLPIGHYSNILDQECIANRYQLHIRILASRLTENTSAGVKTYLTENPIIVYYRIKEPELIECTAEQEQILNNFHTYKNITNITCDGIGTLKVKYKKDLETLFNNINSALVGGN